MHHTGVDVNNGLFDLLNVSFCASILKQDKSSYNFETTPVDYKTLIILKLVYVVLSSIWRKQRELYVHVLPDIVWVSSEISLAWRFRRNHNVRLCLSDKCSLAKCLDNLNTYTIMRHYLPYSVYLLFDFVWDIYCIQYYLPCPWSWRLFSSCILWNI